MKNYNEITDSILTTWEKEPVKNESKIKVFKSYLNMSSRFDKQRLIEYRREEFNLGIL